MKEGIGTTFNLTLLFFFILLMASFALFGTSYYRAFSVKNNLITMIEQYEGNFGEFKEKRKDLMKKIGYSVNEQKVASNQKKDFTCPSGEGWCYKIVSGPKYKNGFCQTTYHVKTFVSTDIPIINRIFTNTGFFEVSGTTKPVKRRGSC